MLVRVYPRAWSCHRREPQVLVCYCRCRSDSLTFSCIWFCMWNILHYNLKQLVFKVITCRAATASVEQFVHLKVKNIANCANKAKAKKSLKLWSTSSTIYALLFGHFLRFSKHNLHIKNAAKDANDDKGNNCWLNIRIAIDSNIDKCISVGLDTRFRSHAPHFRGNTFTFCARQV